MFSKLSLGLYIEVKKIFRQNKKKTVNVGLKRIFVAAFVHKEQRTNPALSYKPTLVLFGL